MFEARVLRLLQRYLGDYVHGISAEALRISVWKGDVVLKDLKLKAEALNSLNLPVIVKAGFVGSITLKVPWKSLGKEPVIVLINRVFVLAHPAPSGRTLTEEDERNLFEGKMQQIEEEESATLEAILNSKQGSSSPENSSLGSVIATIIGNLKISISNVHIRYEDPVSNPGHSFSVGATLAKLAAVTTNEHGKETFNTSGALDKLWKVILQLAESGSFFSQVDLFKVRGKFALSDAYEDHFLVRKGKILVVTHRRVILLQQPSNIIAQRKFSPAKDPCSIVWDVLWDDLVTMELGKGKKDNPKSPPSRIILYIHARTADLKEQTHVIKCLPETYQAMEVYSSVELAVNTYGPNKSKDMPKRKVRKPYSPNTEGSNSENQKEGLHLSLQHVPASVPQSSIFGSSGL